MRGVYLSVSERNEDLPILIDKYSKKHKLSKADTVTEMFRAYENIGSDYQEWQKQRKEEQFKREEEQSKSFGRLFSNAV